MRRNTKAGASHVPSGLGNDAGTPEGIVQLGVEENVIASRAE